MGRTVRTLLGLSIGLVVCLSLAIVYPRWKASQLVAPKRESGVETSPGPDGDLVAQVIVKEIRIAEAKDFADLHARFPHKWERYVVRFELTKVLTGRVAKPELSVLVHSPSLELNVREEGQRGVLHVHRTSGRYEFVPAGGKRWAGRAIGTVPVQ